MYDTLSNLILSQKNVKIYHFSDKYGKIFRINGFFYFYVKILILTIIGFIIKINMGNYSISN